VQQDRSSQLLFDFNKAAEKQTAVYRPRQRKQTHDKNGQLLFGFIKSADVLPAEFRKGQRVQTQDLNGQLLLVFRTPKEISRKVRRKSTRDIKDQLLLDFIWPAAEKQAEESRKGRRKHTRDAVDYEAVYRLMLSGPVTFRQIKELTGMDSSGASQVITTLSLMYPVWSPARGIYKLIGKDDDKWV
jgi:hypothetical protein